MPSAQAEIYFIAAMMLLILVICGASVFFFFRQYKKEMIDRAERSKQKSASKLNETASETRQQEQV